MKEFENLSIKVRNFLCFGNEYSGFDNFKLINVLIGRNNCGKSTLIEVIKSLCSNGQTILQLKHRNEKVDIILKDKLNEYEIKRFFREDTSGGEIGTNHWQYGRNFVDKYIEWTVSLDGKIIKTIDEQDPPNIAQENFNNIVVNKNVYFNQKFFKKLSSERDIKPEAEGEIVISADGQGITSNIARYLTYANLPGTLIEDVILTELNNIFEPDLRFTSIAVQKLENGQWEIFLGEKNKGKIALSRSGSGLKTVICVLAYLFLIPDIEKRKISDYVFAFEELENNLHPSAQRKLFDYLRNIAVDAKCMIFLTTHSNVVIDLFSNYENAQIIHVQHNGEFAIANRVVTYLEHKGILDDLDIRASDLLQSNCVIWLEGPSDRLYFNRWMELWSKGELREGVHYQCVFYGGRLLAHLTACEANDNVDNLINILRVNRNAVLLIDSDKLNENDILNVTKIRMIEEVNNMGGFSWVTAGKEIENYLPKEAIQSFLKTKDIKQVGQYEKINNYLDTLKEDEGEKFLSNKVLYAEYFLPFLTMENMYSVLDLKHKIALTVNSIKKWNGIS
jgi:putative ATP-dependent endonuclease of the OLD family